MRIELQLRQAEARAVDAHETLPHRVPRVQREVAPELLPKRPERFVDVTRWLCGHGPDCDAAHGALRSADPEKAARMLATAARNIGKHAVVGTLDRLGDALRLVSATVPSFFGGARDDEIPCNKCGNGSLAAPRPPPSAENLQMLHDANALDIALYAYAAERFDAHFDACFSR